VSSGPRGCPVQDLAERWPFMKLPMNVHRCSIAKSCRREVVKIERSLRVDAQAGTDIYEHTNGERGECSCWLDAV
jgi:hypothetical protein